MSSSKSGRPSAALVLSFLALFGALSGTALALSRGEVRSKHIANSAVKAKHLRDSAVKTKKLADGAVDAGKIDSAQVQRRVAGSCPSGQAIQSVNQLGAVSCQSAGWLLTGNAGTSPASQFLGTTDNQALNLRVNNARGLRLEPASDGTNQSPNVIGGITDNFVLDGVHSATIAGGGRAVPGVGTTANRITDNFGTVGGGGSNQAGDLDPDPSDAEFATVGGGRGNLAEGAHATVGGGASNAAAGFLSFVGGGDANVTFPGAGGATIGGGIQNEALGNAATVPGGDLNRAAGGWSLAAGLRAKANHQGAFVWGDSQQADIASTASNQFIARASGDFFLQSDSTLDDQGGFLNTSTGGFLSTGGTWTNSSDRNLKEGFEALDPTAVLAKVAALPIRSWNYKTEPGVRHIGPVAQDFHRAFGLGADDRHIATVDSDGVALAAIQALERRLHSERRQRLALERRLNRLEHSLAARLKVGGGRSR